MESRMSPPLNYFACCEHCGCLGYLSTEPLGHYDTCVWGCNDDEMPTSTAATQLFVAITRDLESSKKPYVRVTNHGEVILQGYVLEGPQ